MIIKEEQRLERVLNIYEIDYVGGGEILILTAYAVKENDGLWAYPAPQIFNEEVYLRNKAEYDAQVKDFRVDCEVE